MTINFLNGMVTPVNYNDYEPQKIGDGVYTFALPVQTCPVCQKYMLTPDFDSAQLWKQIQRVDIRRSKYWQKIANQTVCEKCWEIHVQENFECDQCNTTYLKSEVQFQYQNNGTGHLCKTCYSTLTAKEWDAAIKEMKALYKYSD